MKKNIGFIVALIVVAVGSFYGGMTYAGKSNATQNAGNGQVRQFGNQVFGPNGQRGGRNAGNFAVGSILAKDDKSITIQLRDGGSKIVFIATSTPVMKNAAGSVSDLTVGEQVSATGTANADGSLTAESVQIRPAMPQQQRAQNGGGGQPLGQ